VFNTDPQNNLDHTQIIRDYYVFLVDTLDAKHSGLVCELFGAGVLSREEMESVNSEVVSLRQNEKLLSVLSRKTKDQFDKFKDVLDNTGQQHVRNHITSQGMFTVLVAMIRFRPIALCLVTWMVYERL